MPDYSIFVLGETQLSISDGKVLSGVSQGSGIHLDGATITLDSNTWEEVRISDNNLAFSDNDSAQVLDSGTPGGPQVIDGNAFTDGTVVEAEYGLTLSDGVDTWQVVGFNLRNSNPSYATVEGLAFIGGPGGFPPVGVPLTVTGF